VDKNVSTRDELEVPRPEVKSNLVIAKLKLKKSKKKRKKKDKSSQRKEKKATQTLAIVLGEKRYALLRILEDSRKKTKCRLHIMISKLG
jgi:hypothetical protein